MFLMALKKLNHCYMCINLGSGRLIGIDHCELIHHTNSLSKALLLWISDVCQRHIVNRPDETSYTFGVIFKTCFPLKLLSVRPQRLGYFGKYVHIGHPYGRLVRCTPRVPRYYKCIQHIFMCTGNTNNDVISAVLKQNGIRFQCGFGVFVILYAKRYQDLL